MTETTLAPRMESGQYCYGRGSAAQILGLTRATFIRRAHQYGEPPNVLLSHHDQRRMFPIEPLRTWFAGQPAPRSVGRPRKAQAS